LVYWVLVVLGFWFIGILVVIIAIIMFKKKKESYQGGDFERTLSSMARKLKECCSRDKRI